MRQFDFYAINNKTGSKRLLSIQANNLRHAINKSQYFLKENEYINY